MRFNKKLSLVTIGVISSLFIGCGGGGSSSDTKSASVTASDAYVVSLPTPATAECDGIDYNSTNVENGVITFNLPKSVDSSNCVYSIPKDAIVDIDGDGKLSEPDQTIRMPLKTKGAGTVANPLTTSALTKGDLDNFEKFKEFDPVKAKKHLLENPDDNKTAKLVASADAIAYLADEAKKKGLDVSEVLKDVDTNAIVISIENDDSNMSEVVTQVIEPAGKIHNIDTKQIDSKVKETHKAIKELHLAIKSGDINSTDSKEAINAIIAVTDGNVTASEITTAIENKDLKSIIKKVKIDEYTKKEIEKVKKDKKKTKNYDKKKTKNYNNKYEKEIEKFKKDKTGNKEISYPPSTPSIKEK